MAFYERVASVAGIQLAIDESRQARWRFDDGSGGFTFVSGDAPTRNVHLAFGVGDFETVKRFHELATSAGYGDNGLPGERPQYHPGYYGAFVLDPGS
jgi:hypothetical protein